VVTANSGTDKAEAKLRKRDPFIWHKLHSLSGILPIGIFLLQHLIANSYALHGAATYNTVIAVYGYLPFVLVLEAGIIYLPILYHSIYGLYISAYGVPNPTAVPTVRNWMYTLQRISGVIAFLYIGFHLWNTSIQKYIQMAHGSPNPEHVIQYAAMAHQMANPWMFAAYIIGITATVFHFSNGVWNFCIRWGITISANSQRLTAYVCAVMFLVLTGIGLWTASSLRAAGLSSPTQAAAISQPYSSSAKERAS
jgi:succinate dehydrogenase / fumarate reductase cytochrome b subunit